MASDSPDQNLTQYFSLCNDFIHAARLREGNVLIHWYIKMVRTYKKKSSRGSWSVENMKHAIDAVLSKSAGYRKAAQMHGVPQTTLERHVAKIRKGEVSLTRLQVTLSLYFPNKKKKS
ncbi:unnamed protein product [Danaus chrysippus]|uniref:(African queen) hypothetical protein n=1 Tax=Danaus chrysippus TaxID=151541 RepID=A0A8J2VZR2_9NEOP|nr:unnamed protein product [Danaus chrysippus]